jgi:hypothetical protein
MKQTMKRNILLLVCILLLGGCADLRHSGSGSGNLIKQDDTYYLLSCLNDIQNIEPEDFAANFEMAEAELQYGSDQDTLRFICLSLHAKADYKQFKQGTKVLEQFIAKHPESPDDIQGFQILVDRIDEEIINKWSAWKSLLEDKKELKTEVESLQGNLEEDQIVIEELQKQIEQLKNIENIIKSRETEQQ